MARLPWKQNWISAGFWTMTFVMLLSLAAGSEVLVGHLLPFGEHRPAEGSIAEEDGLLDPETFYNRYFKERKPVLFKGGAKYLPAFNLWNDQYLRKEFGKVRVETEIAKKENRTKGMKSMSMAKFLDIYKDSDIYMVQDAVKPLSKDLSLPKPLVCGGFQNLLSAALIWFSSGGTKSVLHNDDIENINCLFDGSKRFYMIDKKFKKEIEGQHYVFRRGYSKVDVDKVDLNKFPGLRDLEWWDVHMEKGDCLYIPSRWYHIVDSAGPRNLAVNSWFKPLEAFNESDCSRYGGKIPDNSPLGFFEMQGMGFPDPPQDSMMQGLQPIEHTTDNVFWEFKGEKEITKDDFKAVYLQDAEEWEMDVVFQILDLQKDGILTWPELQVAQLDALITLFPFLQPIPNFAEIGTQEDFEPTESNKMTKEGTAPDQSNSKEEL